MERAPILTDEHIVELGRKGYPDYSYQADNSDVPIDFFNVSRTMSLDLFPQVSLIDLADIMLGGGFETEDDAWTALKYAEAVSLLKGFYSGLETDGEGPIISHGELREMHLIVGLAMVAEKSEETTYGIKIKVEEYFEDPVNQLKIAFLASYVGNQRVH